MPLVDIAPLIRQLHSQLESEGSQLLAPRALYNTLRIYSSSALAPSRPSTPESTRPCPPPPHSSPEHPQAHAPHSHCTTSDEHLCVSQTAPDQVLRNVVFNRQLTLRKLYVFNSVDAYIDYPETHPDGIGYLFRQADDLAKWRDPTGNFAYSLGAPSGQTKRGNSATNAILHSLSTKEPVACVEQHKTCQGAKVCPHVDMDEVKSPHRVASRELLSKRIREDYDANREILSTSLSIFTTTYQYLIALQRVGCRAEETIFESTPTTIQGHVNALKRGYQDEVRRCKGTMCCVRDGDMVFVQCEHYDPDDSRDHYRLPLDESFDVDYVWAHLNGDPREAQEFEDAAEQLGYLVPNSVCTHVASASSQRLNCPFAHRDEDGDLFQPLMERLACTVKFRRFDPLPEYRHECPYTLVIIRGEHNHPIPLPTKTPPQIRERLFNLFYSMDEDLADLTVRRLLRSPTMRSFLSSVFPGNSIATLSDVHPSLANRSHVRAYIKMAKDRVYPEGTGWSGALELLRKQQENSPDEPLYIRTIVDEDDADFPRHEEDTAHAPTDRSSRLRMLICMTPEQSQRLLDARFLQCDISFKRVVDFREFILVGMDPMSNTAIVYARVYLNRETAEAHRRLFWELDKIVREDTGLPIPWRHVYADTLEDREGLILLLTFDQHGGQGKGFGLYLVDVCRLLDGYDLHEPLRRLNELSPYEHLHRLICICTIHFDRNISEARGLTYEVKTLMRSLNCIQHIDWDGTIRAICEKGGKKGKDWVANKVNSRFAFEGLCQSKSKIPLDIWRAGVRNTNLVESCHFHAYGEGKKCTLVGAIRKGERYDAMRMGTLRMFEATGIRSSYKVGTRYDNAVNAIKRRGQVTAQRQKIADASIRKHNVLVTQLREKINQARTKGTNLFAQINQQRQLVPRNEAVLAKLESDWDKAKKAHERLMNERVALNAAKGKLPKGSGKVKAAEIVMD